MIDGFGIPKFGWKNSVYSKYCGYEFTDLMENYSIALDTCLGIKGIPQSATGQSSLFCGKNTAQIIGAHKQAFPGPAIRKIIEKDNLLKSVKQVKLKSIFANAYVKYSYEGLRKKGLCSVSTIMNKSAELPFKNLEDLLNNKAVYHDLTHKTIPEKMNIPSVSPKKSAENLLKIAENHDFTLFEYFISDHAGHKMDINFLKKTLIEFSIFFRSLINNLNTDYTLILTSDHGNIENPQIKTHTQNPVPLFVYNSPPPNNNQLKSIVNVHNWLLSELSAASENL